MMHLFLFTKPSPSLSTIFAMFVAVIPPDVNCDLPEGSDMIVAESKMLSVPSIKLSSFIMIDADCELFPMSNGSGPDARSR